MMRPIVIEAWRVLGAVLVAFAAGAIAAAVGAGVACYNWWPQIRAELEQRVLGRLLVDCVPVAGEVVTVRAVVGGVLCERQEAGAVREITWRVR